MPRPKRMPVELRYYEVPPNECLLALLGESWKRNYGNDVSFLHFHNLLEIGVCRQGVGKMEFEDGTQEPYRPGMITVLPPNLPHNTLSGGFDVVDFWEYLFVDVEVFLEARYASNPLRARELTARIQHGRHLLTRELNPQLAECIEGLMREMRSEPREYHKEWTANMLHTLLLEIARMEPRIAQKDDGRVGELCRVRAALDHIQAHYEEPLRIVDLAEACGLSETHFRRIFDDAVNMTPVEYINLVRIQKACAMLRTTDESMEVVALKTGFSTQSSFNRNFLRLVGVSPLRWKNSEESYAVNPLRYHITAHEGWR